MNLLLLRPDEISGEYARIQGARAVDLISAHALVPGIKIRAGSQGGALGHATVEEIGESSLRLRLELIEAPPPRLPVILTVGIARPQTIKKVVQAAVTMGVSELHFVRCELAEKSYLKAQVLQRQQLAEEVELGLAQAVDTIAPRIEVHDRFRPFYEDFLPHRLHELGWSSSHLVIADTAEGRKSRISDLGRPDSTWVLAVGPEAGWSQFEAIRLRELGFLPVSLGPRMLRVETAVTALLAQTAQFEKAR